MTASDPKQQWFLGLGLSLAGNAVVGTLLLGLGLLVAIGAGLSSNPVVDRSNVGCVVVLGLVLLGGVNLPGFAYGILGRRWRFLAGWLVGLGVAALLVGALVIAIALYVALVAAGERAQGS